MGLRNGVDGVRKCADDICIRGKRLSISGENCKARSTLTGDIRQRKLDHVVRQDLVHPADLGANDVKARTSGFNNAHPKRLGEGCREIDLATVQHLAEGSGPAN